MQRDGGGKGDDFVNKNYSPFAGYPQTRKQQQQGDVLGLGNMHLATFHDIMAARTSKHSKNSSSKQEVSTGTPPSQSNNNNKFIGGMVTGNQQKKHKKMKRRGAVARPPKKTTENNSSVLSVMKTIRSLAGRKKDGN